MIESNDSETMSSVRALAVAVQRKNKNPSRTTDGVSDSDSEATITATGKGALAEEIVACAFACGIPVRQDSDLATLLAAFDVNTPIPAAALVVVAEILNRAHALTRGAQAV